MIGVNNHVVCFQHVQNNRLTAIPRDGEDLEKSKDRSGNADHGKLYHEQLHLYVGVCVNKIDG